MCPTKRGVEIVKRDFVREVRDGEPERDVGVVFLGKQIVSTEANIQYVPRGDAPRIVIIILGAGRRYTHSRRPKIGFVTLCRSELIVGRCDVASTKEANSRLLGRRQAKNSSQVPYIASNKAAIIAPCERGPGTVSFPLVAQVCRLLKLLVMVDSKGAPIDRKKRARL